MLALSTAELVVVLLTEAQAAEEMQELGLAMLGLMLVRSRVCFVLAARSVGKTGVCSYVGSVWGRLNVASFRAHLGLFVLRLCRIAVSPRRGLLLLVLNTAATSVHLLSGIARSM